MPRHDPKVPCRRVGEAGLLFQVPADIQGMRTASATSRGVWLVYVIKGLRD